MFNKGKIPQVYRLMKKWTYENQQLQELQAKDQMTMIRLPNQLHLLRNQNKRLIHKDKKPMSLIIGVDQLTCRAELSK